LTGGLCSCAEDSLFASNRVRMSLHLPCTRFVRHSCDCLQLWHLLVTPESLRRFTKPLVGRSTLTRAAIFSILYEEANAAIRFDKSGNRIGFGSSGFSRNRRLLNLRSTSKNRADCLSSTASYTWSRTASVSISEKEVQAPHRSHGNIF
jgi:hypothetical protein